MAKEIRRFQKGIVYGLFGLVTSYAIQISGQIYSFALGSLLVILYTAFGLKSDIKTMKRYGIPFSLGVLVVSWVTGDIITIVICLYVCGVTVLRLGNEYGVWPYVEAFFVAFVNFLRYVYPYVISFGLFLKDGIERIWDYLGQLVSKWREYREEKSQLSGAKVNDSQ